MRGMTRDTLVEVIDRKVIYVFVAVTIFALLMIFISRNAEIGFKAQISGEDPMDLIAPNPAFRVIEVYASFLLFLTVMASASHLPNMLERGRAEYYLAKPLSRSSLLMGKFTAILVVYGGMVLLSCLVIFVAFAASHGGFDAGLLLLLAGHLVSLAIWLSATTFAAIFSGSTAMTIMSAFLLWAVEFILLLHDKIAAFVGSPAVGYVMKVLYYIVPKNSEVEQVGLLLAVGQPVPSWTPVWSSLLFAGAALYAATLVFKSKNY